MRTKRQSILSDIACRLLAGHGPELAGTGRAPLDDVDCGLLASFVEGSLGPTESAALRRRLAADSQLRQVLSAYVTGTRGTPCYPVTDVPVPAASPSAPLLARLGRTLAALAESRTANHLLVAVSVTAAVVLVVAAPLALRSREGRQEARLRAVPAFEAPQPHTPPQSSLPIDGEVIITTKAAADTRAVGSENEEPLPLFPRSRGISTPFSAAPHGMEQVQKAVPLGRLHPPVSADSHGWDQVLVLKPPYDDQTPNAAAESPGAATIEGGFESASRATAGLEGDWLRTYREVAPSVVFVSDGRQYATGVVVGPGRLAVADARGMHPGETADGTRSLEVVWGCVADDGRSIDVDRPMAKGRVLHVDSASGIAILGLEAGASPDGVPALPRPLVLAESEPSNQSELLAVGSMSSRSLWTGSVALAVDSEHVNVEDAFAVAGAALVDDSGSLVGLLLRGDSDRVPGRGYVDAAAIRRSLAEAARNAGSD